jgi:membrane-associated phospholipid phosphatase
METLARLDLQLFHFINQTIANDFFDVVCPILRDPTFLAVCYLAFATITYINFPKQFIRIIAIGALTFLLSDQLSSTLIKPFIHRIRPCNEGGVNGRLIIEHCGSGFSFVSSHAANSFGMATFLSSPWIRKRGCVAALLIWAALVSFSQVYVGIHYPMDVVGGAVLGISIGLGTGALYRRLAPEAISQNQTSSPGKI